MVGRVAGEHVGAVDVARSLPCQSWSVVVWVAERVLIGTWRRPAVSDTT
jgi:hypothetical protein